LTAVRAQTSLEFLSLLGVLLIMLVFFSLVSYQRSMELNRAAVSAAGWRACELVSLEVNSASSVGEGYEHSFNLPMKLDGTQDYSLEISASERAVRANWSGGQCLMPAIPYSYSGAPAQGYNRVRNVGGVIVFG